MQLIKYSGVGADVNVESIVIPPKLLNVNYDLETYIQMFLTTSYLLTSPEENSQKVIEVLKKYNMSANVIGKVISKQELRISNKRESIEVINF